MLYKTDEHPCSYLPEQQARTAFIDPKAILDQQLYSQLCDFGYRRSGQFVYRPSCLNCNACQSLRVNVSDYRFNRRERRILNKNKDLDVVCKKDIDHDIFYDLYQRYIITRHSDGDMFPPDRDQYQQFLSSFLDNTLYYCFYQGPKLKAIAVTDALVQGLSAVYTFFDPHDDKRSLGHFAILWQIQQAQARNLDYLYLGYWVKDCKKMSYKTQFQNIEIYRDKKWQLLCNNT